MSNSGSLSSKNGGQGRTLRLGKDLCLLYLLFCFHFANLEVALLLRYFDDDDDDDDDDRGGLLI